MSWTRLANIFLSSDIWSETNNMAHLDNSLLCIVIGSRVSRSAVTRLRTTPVGLEFPASAQIFILFSLFWKIKGCLCDHLAVCVSHHKKQPDYSNFC
jgi:hypothetical protein